MTTFHDLAADPASTLADTRPLPNLSAVASDKNPEGAAVANKDIFVFNGLRFLPLTASEHGADLPEGIAGYYRNTAKGTHLYDAKELRAYLVHNQTQGYFAVSASEYVNTDGRKHARYMHSTCSLEDAWLKLDGRGSKLESDLIEAAHFVPVLAPSSKPTPVRDRTIRVVSFGDTSYWPQSMPLAVEVVNAITAKNGAGLIEQRQAGGTWSITHRFAPDVGLIVEPPKPQKLGVEGDVVAVETSARKMRP